MAHDRRISRITGLSSQAQADIYKSAHDTGEKFTKLERTLAQAYFLSCSGYLLSIYLTLLNISRRQGAAFLRAFLHACEAVAESGQSAVGFGLFRNVSSEIRELRFPWKISPPILFLAHHHEYQCQ